MALTFGIHSYVSYLRFKIITDGKISVPEAVLHYIYR